jgi:hypothetical protein
VSAPQQVTPELGGATLSEHIHEFWILRSPIDWISWSLAYPALGWFAICVWGSWRLYHAPRSIRNTRRFDRRPARFGGGTLLLGAALCALPVAIADATWLGFRTSFSLVQWRTMTTKGMPSYHPDVAAALLFEVAFQLAAFSYSFAVIGSYFEKRRSFPWHFTLIAISIVGCTLFDQIVLATMIQVHREEGFVALLRTALLAGVGINYVHRSSRVAKTFTSGPVYE